ncbi:hypothetical protein ONZ51_g13271 [Trametes cubensis]|uniref:Peroxidase n=1 Tax=Trametes cubensis TaxID=1111947 RepID=A0AAD7TED3_9APHY|nr:hypothetical protein ONZ51_g13271 [Trametes cubensis]
MEYLVNFWTVFSMAIASCFTAVIRTGRHGFVSYWQGSILKTVVIGRVGRFARHTNRTDTLVNALVEDDDAHGTESNGISVLTKPDDAAEFATIFVEPDEDKRAEAGQQTLQSNRVRPFLHLNIATLMAFKSLLAAVTLAASAYAALTRRVTCPDGVNTATNAACCELFAVRDDLQENLFHGGLCTAEAHESLLAGGADGSIAIFSDIETAFHPNIGLDEIVQLQAPFVARHNLSVADFIQFAGAIGASNCAGAPQLAAFVGRIDATRAAPDGLVPEPFHTPDQIFSRLADASQGEFDEILTVLGLLVAHTVAAANDVDPTVPGSPFDSTPSIWDTQAR